MTIVPPSSISLIISEPQTVKSGPPYTYGVHPIHQRPPSQFPLFPPEPCITPSAWQMVGGGAGLDRGTLCPILHCVGGPACHLSWIGVMPCYGVGGTLYILDLELHWLLCCWWQCMMLIQGKLHLRFAAPQGNLNRNLVEKYCIIQSNCTIVFRSIINYVKHGTA